GPWPRPPRCTARAPRARRRAPRPGPRRPARRRAPRARLSLEQLHPHAVARAHVAPLFLDHDEAVGLRHRREDAVALRSGGAAPPLVVHVLEDAALELATPLALAHGLGGHRVEVGREERAPARALPQGGTDEEAEREHRRHRVAGQAEELRSSDAPDGEGTARLHRHLPEVDAARLLQHRLYEIVT